jgi:hypothetical protein
MGRGAAAEPDVLGRWRGTVFQDGRGRCSLTQDNYLRPRLNGTCVWQLLSMERREENAFAGADAGDTLKLAIVRDLQRHFSTVLIGPYPPGLEPFIALLETDLSSQHSGKKG